MIIPCMKLTSAMAGVRRGMTAVSGERILLLCPGAPGCTMGAAVSGWPQAFTALTKSTTTKISQTQSCRLDSVANEPVSYTCRGSVIIIVSPTRHKASDCLQDWMIRLATRPGNDALGNATAVSETWESRKSNRL